MAVFKRGGVWWYEFTFAGRRIRESAKTSRKTIAVEAEKRHRLELEKSLAGMPIEARENRIATISAMIDNYQTNYAVTHRPNRRRSPRMTHLRSDRVTHKKRRALIRKPQVWKALSSQPKAGRWASFREQPRVISCECRRAERCEVV